MSRSTAAPAAAAPTILIVGGVAGGASAAARARRMNEQARIVILRDFALNRRLPASLATVTGLPAPDAIMID